MKHTPGPWRINQYTNYEGFSVSSETDPEFGCIAERWENINNESRNESRLAHATLIAAAPDLLEALEQVDHALWSGAGLPNGIWDQICADAQNAIAKATP